MTWKRTEWLPSPRRKSPIRARRNPTRTVVVMAVPCVILFLLLQRYYVRGFMSGAIKG